MKRIVLLLIVGFMVLLTGCDPQPSTQMLKEMKFAIDSNLIDKQYINIEYGFSFSPPIHFLPFSSTELEIFQQDAGRIENDTESVRSRFVSVFGDSLTRGLLIVSEITLTDSGRISLEHYDAMLQSRIDSSKVNVSRFLKKGKPVTLFVTRDESYFTYVLFFESSKGKLLQLNYQIPADVNISFSGAIESSIGTLSF